MSKKPKKFKKKVEWDDSINPREEWIIFSGTFGFLFFTTAVVLIIKSNEIYSLKLSMALGLISIIGLIIAHIPKRKVYWEEVKNE